MLSDKGDRLNQVCGIHTKVKSPVVKGVCIACLLFGILPLGGDFYLHLMKICYPTLGMLTKILTSCRPANLQNMQIWRCRKKAQKNLEIGTSNLEISKICVK